MRDIHITSHPQETLIFFPFSLLLRSNPVNSFLFFFFFHVALKIRPTTFLLSPSRVLLLSAQKVKSDSEMTWQNWEQVTAGGGESTHRSSLDPPLSHKIPKKPRSDRHHKETKSAKQHPQPPWLPSPIPGRFAPGRGEGSLRRGSDLVPSPSTHHQPLECPLAQGVKMGEKGMFS